MDDIYQPLGPTFSFSHSDTFFHSAPFFYSFPLFFHSDPLFYLVHFFTQPTMSVSNCIRQLPKKTVVDLF